MINMMRAEQSRDMVPVIVGIIQPASEDTMLLECMTNQSSCSCEVGQLCTVPVSCV